MGGAVEVGLVGVEGDVPVVRGCEPTSLGLLRVEADQGFLYQPVDLADAHSVGERCDVPVDVVGTLGWQADGAVGDPAGAPWRQVPGLDACPDAGESVGELERFGDQGAARVGGDVQSDGELVGAELADLGCAFAGDQDRALEPEVVSRVGLVHHGPVEGQLEDADLGPVGGRLLGLGSGQHRGGGVRLFGCGCRCHGAIGSGGTDSFRTGVHRTRILCPK